MMGHKPSYLIVANRPSYIDMNVYFATLNIRYANRDIYLNLKASRY